MQLALALLSVSFVVASLSTVLCVLVSALAAYALTRLRIPGRNAIMAILLAIAMTFGIVAGMAGAAAGRWFPPSRWRTRLS